jgi:hypothetical protein
MGNGTRRCARCGADKPATAEHFYFDWRGRITGYCRLCAAAYNAAYYRERMTAQQRARNREAARNWQRRTHGTPPERYRVGVAS